jgi:hypothetical protein
MKFLLQFIALIFSLGVTVVEALPPQANQPSPTPSPSVSASPTPFVLPIPSAAPSRAPDAHRASAITVPRPNPASVIARPPAPTKAAFLSGSPDLARFERAVPAVEVWRSGSNVPRKLKRINRRFEPLLISGSEPTTVVLRFHPLLAGSSFTVTGHDGSVIQPGDGLLRISPRGEATFFVEVDPVKTSGRIVVRVDGVVTVLRVLRVPEAIVIARETQSEGGH